MSYILDALKKSEMEERNRRIPDLNSRHDLPGSPAPASNKAGLVVSLVLVALLVAVTVRYVLPTMHPGNTTAPVIEEASEQTGTETFIPEAPLPSVVDIDALPEDVKASLPAMTFSSHIFADAPDLRIVNINDRKLREGDWLNSQVRVVEITEEGVLLQSGRYRFEMSVLRDWSFR